VRGGSSARHESCFEHAIVVTRLQRLREIRQKHEDLRSVIRNIIDNETAASASGGATTSAANLDFLSTKEIDNAFSVFYSLDVLDTS
jgi:hypothetical protein